MQKKKAKEKSKKTTQIVKFKLNILPQIQS